VKSLIDSRFSWCRGHGIGVGSYERVNDVAFQDCDRLKDELHGQAFISIERRCRLSQQVGGARQRLGCIAG